MTRLVAVLDLNTGQFNTKLDDAEKRTGKASGAMGKAMKAVGVGIAAAGTAAAGLAVASVKSAADFESAFSNVATLLGTDAPKEIGKLKQGILDLDPALGSATDLTNGLYQALSAGVKPAESIKFIDQAARLAKAGLADMEATVKVLAGTINAYGEKSLNTEQVSDMLFQTVKAGVVELPELAAGLGQVSSVAAAAGVSQRDLLASIASITKAGVPASQAMNSIKAAISNILTPSEKAEFAAEDMGFAFSAAELQSKGLIGLLGEMAKATDGNVEKTAKLFGSVEALGGVLALTRGDMQPYKEDLAAMDEAIAANGRVTELAFRQQQEGFTASLAALKNAWEQIMIGVGTELLPELTRVSKELLKHVDDATEGVKFLVTVAKEAFSVVQSITSTLASGTGMAVVMAEQAAAGNLKGVAAAAGLGETGQRAAQGVGSVMYTGANFMTGGALAASGASSRDIAGAVGSGMYAGANVMTGGALELLVGGKRAGGGPVGTRNAYLVGERGPELFVPGADGNIVPNSKLRYAGARAKGGEVTVTSSGVESLVGASAGSVLPSAAYGAPERDGLLPGKALEDLKKRIHAAAKSGVTAGVMEGGKEGAGDKKKRKGLWGDLSEAAKGGSAMGTIEGIMSGDVDAASRLFQKGFGKGLAEEAKAMLVKALGKKLLGSIFGGGFGGFFAEGGRPPVGVPSIVGERGPEVFVPDTAGRVIPNAALAGVGGISLSFGDIHLETGTSAQDSARQLAADLMDSIVALVEGGRGDRLIRAMDRRRR